MSFLDTVGMGCNVAAMDGRKGSSPREDASMAAKADVPNGGTQRALTVQQRPYRSWNQAYRVSNGLVELVIVPAIGRIMRYGFVGERNVLWENFGPPSIGNGGEVWANHGGDKGWPWPEAVWQEQFLAAWPPPTDADGLQYDGEVLPDGAIRVSSGLLSPQQLRIVREIRLAPQGTRVSVRTVLECVSGVSTIPWGAWAVVQVSQPSKVLARLLHGTDPDQAVRPMAGPSWRGVRLAADMMELRPPIDQRVKVGVEADMLAAVIGNILFVQSSPTAAREDGYGPAERAQVYSEPPILNGKPNPPYVELEFISPRRTFRPAQSVNVSVMWEMHRLKDGYTDAGLLEHMAAGSGALT
jgi:hypothetical protein